MRGVLLAVLLAGFAGVAARGEEGGGALPRVRVSDDGGGFVAGEEARPFAPWGFNYDHDRDGRLIEDYWGDEWDTVVEDFKEMKSLGANVVRVHLQVGRFMEAPDRPNPEALERLRMLLDLAGSTGLYLDLTGLGCYHRDDVPPWFDALPEAGRWAAQARFWEAVAAVGTGRPAVFCYDLMNEPVVTSGEEPADGWLGAAFGGKHFVQRINLEPMGRTRAEIAEAWTAMLTAAIRKHDPDALVTVGVIPWALVFPKAKPVFYSPPVVGHFDFVAVHFYPESGKLGQAMEALRDYDVGLPVVVEETFPLKCSQDELATFIRDSRGVADGWISFYWGQTADELEGVETIGGAITRDWLRMFSGLADEEP